MIAYESFGEGPAIVLAHGVAGNHASWFQQVPVLSKSYRVVTFDHRGFGRLRDDEGLGRSGFVDDLKTLLDTLEIDQACLVGQSMGVGTAVGFAARYPERVSALVLSDGVFGIALPDEARKLFDRARAEADSLSQLERVLGRTVREHEPDKAHLYQALASFNQTNRKTLGGSWEPLLTPEALAAVGVPILFVVGQEDPLVPPPLVHELAARVAGAFVVEISDAGHSPYFERPTEFNDSVLSFLQATGIKGVAAAPLSNSAGYT